MIITAMELCTSNVTFETSKACTQACAIGPVTVGWPAMSMAAYSNGWFMTVPELVYLTTHNSLPDDLLTVMLYARNLGVNLVRFDSDVEPDDNLPTFDW